MLRVRTNFVVGVGGAALSTMYFIGNDTQAGADFAVAAVGTFWGAVDARLLTTTTWATEAEVALVSPVTGEASDVFQTTPQAGAGALTGEYGPPTTQGLARWNTTQFNGGRRLRGRTFIPGISEAENNGGFPSAAFQTAVNNAMTALIADANADLAIWSRQHAVAANAVTGSAWTQWAVLRSRRS